MQTLFFLHVELASDFAKVFCSFHGSKTTGDFLLYFGHPDIPLPTVICKGNFFGRHKTKGFYFKVT